MNIAISRTKSRSVIKSLVKTLKQKKSHSPTSFLYLGKTATQVATLTTALISRTKNNQHHLSLLIIEHKKP